jgi:WD40 repeat protein
LLRALPAHTAPVNCVAWHPSRPCVAACSDDYSLTVWSA